MTVHRWFLGSHGGVESWAAYDDATDEIIAGDVQSAAVNQAILDECAAFRRAERENSAPVQHRPYGRLVAKIPITLWHVWREEWTAARKNGYPYQWGTFANRRLLQPEFKGLLCTEKPFPDTHPADRVAMLWNSVNPDDDPFRTTRDDPKLVEDLSTGDRAPVQFVAEADAGRDRQVFANAGAGAHD